MARVLFWICGKCGFKNHPRIADPKAARSDAPIDDQLCEQCGTSVTDTTFVAQKFTPA